MKIGEQFSNSYIPPSRNFFNWLSCWFRLLCKKNIIAAASLPSSIVAGLKLFLRKLARVLRSLIWKKWRAGYPYLMPCSCLGIINNLRLHEVKNCQLFYKDN